MQPTLAPELLAPFGTLKNMRHALGVDCVEKVGLPRMLEY
jgi:hypothetical protein